MEFPILLNVSSIFKIKLCVDQKRTSLKANHRHIGQEKGGKKAKIWGEEPWGHNETLRCYVCSFSGSRVYPKTLNSNIRSFDSDCLGKIVLREFAILTRGLQVAEAMHSTYAQTSMTPPYLALLPLFFKQRSCF